MPGEGMEALSPFPHTLPYASLLSGCLSVCFIPSFYNKPVKINVSLSSVSHSSKLSSPKRGVVGFLIYNQSVRSTGENLGLVIGICSWGSSSLGRVLSLWELMPSPGRQCQN